MTKYHAGMLDQSVTIKRRTQTPDGQGGVTETVSDYDTPFAHVRMLSSSEAVAAERLEGKANVMVVLRGRSDLLLTDAISWNGTVMQIRGGLPAHPRAKWLELVCELGAAS